MPTSFADYLTIGHLTRDVTETGYILGGTGSYASRTALSFEIKPALITSHSQSMDLSPLNGVEIINIISRHDTTYENIQTPAGRVQMLYETAERMTKADIPEEFHRIPIVHIGPMANEVDEDIVSVFSPDSLIGITPQGWMRTQLPDKHVGYQPWQPSEGMVKRADAVIISDEDVKKNESVIHDYAQRFKLLVVTEGFNGARVYWHGDARHFSAPRMDVLDPTGAGDIFAAVFLIRLKATGDPWKAAETAVRLASLSVTRTGLDSVPTIEEVKSSLIEIIKGSPSQ